jgi:hypothetical protein
VSAGRGTPAGENSNEGHMHTKCLLTAVVYLPIFVAPTAHAETLKGPNGETMEIPQGWVKCSNPVDGVPILPVPSEDLCRAIAGEYQFLKTNRNMPESVLSDHCVNNIQVSSLDLSRGQALGLCEWIASFLVDPPGKN